MKIAHLTSEIQMRFPDGKSGALVMSYDDGSEHDRRLVDIFNRYGIRGSFHLNSGKLGQGHHIAPGEVRKLYQGHEVACHTVSHADLTQLTEAEIRREILDDRQALEDLTGMPVRGLAYPFGAHDHRVGALLPELGIEYARTTKTMEGFKTPQNYLQWETSGHHTAALELAKRFLDGIGQSAQLLYIWGHSYELDGFMSHDPLKNWQYMETFCQLLGNRHTIWYTTTIELLDYIRAFNELMRMPDTPILENTTDRTLWFSCGGTTTKLAPGEKRTP